MKKILLTLIVFFSSFSAISAQEQSLETAIVSRVIDGDTVELSDGRTVRYIGVNTPETRHPTKGQECFGQEAKVKNIELVQGKEVRLEKDVNETDRYGRLLRYVYVQDQMINGQLVAEGYAFSSAYPPDVKYQQTFEDLQKVASDEKRGLWGATCRDAIDGDSPDGEVKGAQTKVWLELFLDTLGITNRSLLRKPLEELLRSFLL